MHRVHGPLEAAKLLPLFDIPQSQGAVRAPREDSAAVRGKDDTGDSPGMALETAYLTDAILLRGKPRRSRGAKQRQAEKQPTENRSAQRREVDSMDHATPPDGKDGGPRKS